MKIPGLDREDGSKGIESNVNFEFDLEVVDGSSFRLTKQEVFINGESVEPNHEVLVAAPVTLKALEQVGIKARVVEWESDKDELELVLFIKANEFAATALLDASELIKAAELFLDK